MDSRPPNLPLLLLTCILHFWPSARGQTSHTIDMIGLTIEPDRSTVESGTRVTLRCQVRVSHSNIPDLKHDFQLRRDDVPIHSSTTTEDSIIYELDPARAADSGSYECRVTVKGKSRTSSSKKLDVTGLQTPVLYLPKTEPFEGEEFSATCSAPDEKGFLIFRFYQGLRTGDIRMIKQTASTRNSSETTMSLRMIGDSLLFCDYDLSLISGTRRSNSSNQIPVIVKGLYIAPTMNVLPSSDVFEGDIIDVYCKVVNPPKDTRVYLSKDQMILKEAPGSLVHRLTVKEGDSGELVCKAEWGNMIKETYHSITVKELFSKPRLTVEPVEIFEGDPFKLTCSVSIHFPDKISIESMRFSIYKDKVKIINSKTYVTSGNGNYSCQALAGSGRHSFVKESRTVVIKAKIPVSKPMLSVVGGTLVLGKRFQLLCHSDNGTLPINYTLYTPNKQKEHRMVTRPGEQAIFNSSAVYKTSALKEFLCHAQNGPKEPSTASGQQLLRSTIIEPVSRPVLRILPSMGDVSEGQDMTLVCSVQSGTPPISFAWYRAGTKGELYSRTSTKPEGSYSISNVRGEHQGGYYCVSTNPANETKQSYTIMIGVKMAGWKKGVIAVIIFILLLILVLSLIFAFRRRLLLFKRRRTGELSVKSASTKAERLSLTQAEFNEVNEVNEAANVTPGMMGKSVWSEHTSGSESEDQNSVTVQEKPPEPRYTEEPTRQAEPSAVPVKTATENEVRNSVQGVPEQADAGSVEYAQLNHETDHHGDHHHGDHGVQDDHIDEIDECVQTDSTDQGPDC